MIHAQARRLQQGLEDFQHSLQAFSTHENPDIRLAHQNVEQQLNGYIECLRLLSFTATPDDRLVYHSLIEMGRDLLRTGTFNILY